MNEVKSFVDNAFKAVRDFVKKVLSFAIDKIILGILQFGKLLVFIKKFLSNPRKYLKPLSQKISGYLKGVDDGFKAQIDKYFGNDNKAVTTTPENEISSTAGAIQKKDDPSATQDSATWSEIGEGVWDIMKKKWTEVKKDPLSIVFNLLMDLALPIVGNIKDIIKLFKDIKKIVTKPLGARSLEEFWTSLLHLLDIPILIYNTFWSIVGRSLALPLIIASFVPHPVVKAIAIAAGYALLAALITGELANIGQKLLLLKTGSTNESEKKDAYNGLADSLIAFAMEAAMAILILVVAAVGHVVKGVFGFIRGKVFKPKIPSKKAADIDVSSGKKTDVPESTQRGRPEDGASTAKPGDFTPDELRSSRKAAQNKARDPENIKDVSDPSLAKTYDKEIDLGDGRIYRRDKKTKKWCLFKNPRKCGEDLGDEVNRTADLSSTASKVFEEIASFRKGLEVPTTGTLKEKGVVTKLDVNGNEYFGINSWAKSDDAAKQAFKDEGFVNPETGKVPHRAVANHAEGDVFLQAFKSGNKGGHGKLFIDAARCGFCKSGVHGLAKTLKLVTLEIFELLETGSVKYTLIKSGKTVDTKIIKL